MSGLVRPPEAADAGPRLTPERLRGFFIDLAVVGAVFAALAVVGALLWHQLVGLPYFTRTADGGQMDQVQLSHIIGIDGWFFVIALLFGLAGGVALTLLRPGEPVEMVVLVALGGALGAWLMLLLGLHLGPSDPAGPLRAAATGAHVPIQLKPQAKGVEYAWPFGAVLGALIVLITVVPRTAPPAGASGDAQERR